LQFPLRTCPTQAGNNGSNLKLAHRAEVSGVDEEIFDVKRFE
jgi:hypothetical protein